MARTPLENLDDLIQTVLAAEAPQPVPPTLFPRIQRRLRIAVLAQDERRCFRQGMLFGASIGLILVGGAVLAAFLAPVLARIHDAVPGLLGYIDYFAVALAPAQAAGQVFPGAAHFWATCLFVAAALVVALLAAKTLSQPHRV
jgi:hypothetical protein